MVDKILSLFFGTKHERDIKRLTPLVQRINALEPDMKKLSLDEMRSKTAEFRRRLERGETLDDLLPEAFALAREASLRTLGMRPFDVQLMGGVVLHEGKISEMKTGEGKTLVATMPVYLNALSGKGAHVVTVNDYLARRDAEWMSPIYTGLGLTVGIIQHDMDPYARQEAYACDITYGTNNEFGFDYLRDNMVEHKSLRVQRPLNYAIVDEVDSILIDEARTPLIISGSTDESTKKYYLVNRIIPSLIEKQDFEVNEKDRTALLTEAGVKHVERLLKLENMYDPQNIELVHHVNQALKAHTLFKRDVDYIVKEGEVVIVDEFTGRLMPGRRYSDGLHQALEAKENVTIARESQTLATITFQNFFRMYTKLAGMTGTADTEAMEFKKIYGLDVVVVPTNEPMVRKDYPDRIYRTEREKFNAIVDEIETLSRKGQPVLVGTISIERSEKLARILKAKGVPHNVLNAKFHEREAAIVAEAGRPGAVTIATNMAGRGTDIVLGGRKTYLDELESHAAVHDAGMWGEFRNAVLGGDFDRSAAHAESMLGQDKHKAQEIARKGREWTQNNKTVVSAGGLHILGTERHEARRIDNQLRGRSGRQGDPGSSRFYLSLEDDLMRVFGSDRISNVMQRLGMEEGQEIESRMVSRAIENAQKRVEGRNFEIRKHLLEYDDVMNTQREYIYRERNEILEGEDISAKILGYIAEVCREEIEFIVGNAEKDDNGVETVVAWLRSKFLLELDPGLFGAQRLPADEIVRIVEERLVERYREKERELEPENMRTLERMISLQVIDSKWREHLLGMDELREGIWTVGYGERNPLVEYKIQGSQIFGVTMNSIKQDIIEFLFKVQVERIVEEQPRAFRSIGQEFHPELEQFGAGGGIMDVVGGEDPRAAQRHLARHEEVETVGGVKRKKTRRNRRR
ncbi:MAG TPA: preprotein translocase subunit SecA [Spirochaetota bacterium]|nr:preprotein translocase subunit SecA [Spirochaetota bacterium]HOS39403.1 preprotein translocase subunit SecA [Spirochaetota bacterium]HPU88543.1 preprotein translocase subunit SecA [Spirochaetota bacterium]